jgi:bifunctional non-homologous end joining protein LigD
MAYLPAKQGRQRLSFDTPRNITYMAPRALAVRPEERRTSPAPPASAIAISSMPPINLDQLPATKPSFLVPMECRLSAAVPNGAQWLYELKLDSYRAIAVRKDAVSLLSRYGRSFNDRFPAMVDSLERLRLPPCVLDGEIVALDKEGRPDFQELQNSRSTRQPIVYYIFEILNYNERDLTGVPLRDRRELLEQLSRSFIDPVRTSTAFRADATELPSEVQRMELEGVVAKRADSIYETRKRPGSWIKYRLNQRREFVIGGYRHRYDALLDSILVGRFERGHLLFVDKLKNGFVAETRKQVFAALEDFIVPECPFANLPERADRRGAVDAEEMKYCGCVKPVQQCEIDFVEWTRRSPSPCSIPSPNRAAIQPWVRDRTKEAFRRCLIK